MREDVQGEQVIAPQDLLDAAPESQNGYIKVGRMI